MRSARRATLALLILPVFLLAECSSRPSQEAIEGYTRAYEAYIRGDLEEALVLTRRNRDAAPDLVQNLVLMARILYFTGDFEEAEEVLRAAQKRDPVHIDVAKWLARVYLETDRTDEASLTVEKAISQSAEDPELLILLAQIRRRQGDLSEAIELYEKTRIFSQRLAQAAIDLAEIYLAFGLPERSRAELERAKSLVDEASPVRSAIDSALRTLPHSDGGQS